MLGNISCFCYRLLIFFKVNVFKTRSKCHTAWIQIKLTKRRSWSWPKLLSKFISRRHKSPPIELITVPMQNPYYGRGYAMSEHQICGLCCIFTRSDPCRNSSLMLIHGVLALNILTSVIEQVCFVSSVWIRHLQLAPNVSFSVDLLRIIKEHNISTH